MTPEKLGQVENPRWPLLLEKSYSNKITFSRTVKYIWTTKVCMQHQWDLVVFKITKKKQKTAELGHNDLLSVYKSNFAQMPISRENMNLFWSDLTKIVPELNFFKFKQMDYPRLSPRAFKIA